MKRAIWRFSLAVMPTTTVAAPVWAGGGNGAPSGAHYNLNIIGVDNPKTSTLTGSDRHTIFVALGSKKPAAPVKRVRAAKAGWELSASLLAYRAGQFRPQPDAP